MAIHTTIESSVEQRLADILLNQYEAFRETPCAGAALRRERLRRLKQMLVENKDDICKAIDADFSGRSSHETLSAEYLPSIMSINDALWHVKGWMKPKHKMAPWMFQPAMAKVVAQPLGIVGVIVPWNYPLYLAIGPLVGALAAGNHAMIKMSEFTPQFGQLFADLVARYFPQSLITVVNGEVEVARAFSALPFDHLLFTGSTAVGKHVMRAASDNLTPVTLELGGKSPAVIDRSMPIAEAVERLVFPKCLNAGQTCVAPDYVLCPEEQVDDFIQRYIAEAKRQYGDIKLNEDFSCIINSSQRQRLIGYIDEAKAAGAEVYIAGDSENLNDYGNKLPPVLLKNVPPHCKVMTEEIFGPILPVVEYGDLPDVLQYINSRPHPLALYVFGYDARLRQLFEHRTQSGALLFNEALIHVAMENLPFGGVGASGMGHYHGKYGFNTFSKFKPVVSKERISTLKLMYPPYKSWLLNLLLKLMRG
ncbi:coniferyl aldehyde dehydrogenase [Reinekea marinisedimentorum]|uniref:Aldehyde dehydrogenase n=1 Tax=Reinekea marinisedimentorum TaxID=230495 RepID=A0A4R3HX67_9GAMM|nr:coniferyl aldehyde dehydrogenase [Reinekea marinisedimentorum]TCS37193.1 coniferyl-aldehyde dehydrogenase [Reinekea marinisedimentorum]